MGQEHQSPNPSRFPELFPLLKVASLDRRHHKSRRLEANSMEIAWVSLPLTCPRPGKTPSTITFNV